MFKVKSETNAPKSDSKPQIQHIENTEGLNYWQIQARNKANSKLPRDWWEGMNFENKFIANAAKYAPGYNWWSY